jgi:hypothetical protein
MSLEIFNHIMADNTGMFELEVPDKDDTYSRFMLQPFLQVNSWETEEACARYHSDNVTDLKNLPHLVGYINAYYSDDECDSRAHLMFARRIGVDVPLFTIQDAVTEAIQANNISAIEALWAGIKLYDDYCYFGCGGDDLITALEFSSLETVLHIMYTVCNLSMDAGYLRQQYDVLMKAANKNPDKRVLRLMTALRVCVKQGILTLEPDLDDDEPSLNAITLFYNTIVAATSRDESLR